MGRGNVHSGSYGQNPSYRKTGLPYWAESTSSEAVSSRVQVLHHAFDRSAERTAYTLLVFVKIAVVVIPYIILLLYPI